MEILFGKVPAEDRDDTDFVSETGEHFYFRATLADDDFIIEDTIGRYIPISRDNLKGLELAAFAAIKTVGAEKEADDLFDKRVREIREVCNFYAGN